MQLARSLIVKDATPNSGNSIFFSVSVCLFPNSSKTANPSELKLRDDSPWDGEGFRLKKHPDSSNLWQENSVYSGHVY